MDEGSGPAADVEKEASRVISGARQGNVLVRLLGGAAVGMHRHVPLPAALQRTYGDIDVVVKRGHDRALRRVLVELGYTPNTAFNNNHGDRRLLFYDEQHSRQLDVFIGAFRMCHELDLDDRLGLDPNTLAPADLLLTKLQVVKINQKDIVDALALMLGHQLKSGAGDVIDLDRLIRVTSRDWGWYTTFTDNLAELAPAAAKILPRELSNQVSDRVATIQKALAAASKSLQWKARSSVGRRVSWYELPEEVGRG